MINEHFNDFINEYIEQNIKPGTKAVIRGNKFNTIIKKYLNESNKDLNLNIQFEKQSNKFNYDEIPDWIIEKDNKILIGMNQIDLWNGGEQINRGLKYLKFTYDKEKYKNFDIKLICVVCNKLKLISNKNKKNNKATIIQQIEFSFPHPATIPNKNIPVLKTRPLPVAF